MRPAAGPYGTASAAVNPYEHRAPAEPVTGEDAPAPLNAYDADAFAPNTARPAAQRPVVNTPYMPSYAAPAFNMPQQQAPAAPAYNMPQYQTPAAPASAPVQVNEPVGSEKDDFGVPAYLRRKK